MTELRRSGKKSFKGSNNFIDEDFLAEENWISVEDSVKLADVRLCVQKLTFVFFASFEAS